jgi:hypothetical protein
LPNPEQQNEPFADRLYGYAGQDDEEQYGMVGEGEDIYEKGWDDHREVDSDRESRLGDVEDNESDDGDEQDGLSRCFTELITS